MYFYGNENFSTAIKTIFFSIYIFKKHFEFLMKNFRLIFSHMFVLLLKIYIFYKKKKMQYKSSSYMLIKQQKQVTKFEIFSRFSFFL